MAYGKKKADMGPPGAGTPRNNKPGLLRNTGCNRQPPGQEAFHKREAWLCGQTQEPARADPAPVAECGRGAAGARVTDRASVSKGTAIQPNKGAETRSGVGVIVLAAAGSATPDC